MFTNPVFSPVRSRKSLTVSATHSGDRFNLGEVSFDDGQIKFWPNSVKTGGVEAAKAVNAWVSERKSELLTKLSALYDPSFRADAETLAKIEAARA